MDIAPLGDCAALIRVADKLEDQTLDQVLAVQDCLIAADIRGVVEVTSAYTTIGVFYDPTKVKVSDDKGGIFEVLSNDIRAALPVSLQRKTPASRLIDIPVCYDEEVAPDLAEVAAHAGMSAVAAAELHSSVEYRVNCIGFMPGFPYLTGLPAELAVPRKSSPRKEVPAGSVAIGGSQTGIYPSKSPGGWNIIGRTPLRLFDPLRTPPSLLAPGDRVRLHRITQDELINSSA